ncbi:YopX family protein [Helcococcus kunzii]|uniref:YopX family protein n=1 Tax=Helcococcus kunzii TaxID=40091 RepID=UPI0038A2DC9D
MMPKFRAFYKPNKKMYEVLTLDIIDKKALIENNDNPKKPLRGYAKMDEIKLMQSTGLFDKNGVEIFEGDILTDEGSFENDGWDYATIEFDETDYLTWKNEGTCQSITECENYSVAGNIYENPELLEG